MKEANTNPFDNSNDAGDSPTPPRQTTSSHETQTKEENMANFSATYSPDDNKMRLYAASRLDKDLYQRVKDAGFRWAPKQGFFVAPMWTPAREDLLIELAGAVDDEDTSLVDRAEERAERFEDYSVKRAGEAEGARKTVSSIADNIPFGQPILKGHHSERRARKDAQRIEDGMRRAVKLWETSEYWTHRAAAAIQHAKYKELPAVRHRRIKGIETDKRKTEKSKGEAQKWLAAWSKDGLTHDAALAIAGNCWLHLPRKEGDREDFKQSPTAYDALNNGHPSLYAPRTLAEVVDHAKKAYPRSIAHCDRWIAHYENRLSYERAMLDEQGGLKADAFDLQVGGQVLIRNEWVLVVRVNKRGGIANSITTSCRYVPIRGIEEIKDYRAPSAEQAAKVQKAAKIAPLANFPGEGFVHITKAEWDKLPADYKGTEKRAESGETGAHRVRHALGVFLKEKIPAEDRGDMNRRHHYYSVFITDAKTVSPPAAAQAAPAEAVEQAAPAEAVEQAAPAEAVEQAAPAAAVEQAAQVQEDQQLLLSFDEPAAIAPAPIRAEPVAETITEKRAAFAVIREQLRAGVQVVSAPQLFPTPPELAARMVEAANIPAGARVLEPSAGTGAILSAFPGLSPFGAYRQTWAGDVVAVEINQSLAANLGRSGLAKTVICSDFLHMHVDDSALFDRVLMNPPFANAQDIEHIKHACQMLKPGGKLVAICANGPRQNAQLRPLVDACGGTWEVLPSQSFAASGTAVNTIMLTLTA